jgi:hypothetical protein
LATLLTAHPELDAALRAIQKLENKLESISDEDPNTLDSISNSKLKTFLQIFFPPCICSGITLITLCFVKPDTLLLDFLVAVGVFGIIIGISTFCVVKGTDKKLNKKITEVTKTFCRNMELFISKEKNLRKLDHAFRMLILIEALKIVKRIFHNRSNQHSSDVVQRAKRAISHSIDTLRASM